MANFYISDLHLCHSNVIRFDNRPFADINEMHQTIIDNWNRAVKTNDTVYILGDFCFAKEYEWPYYLGPLAGRKVLVRGNHDPNKFSAITKSYFDDICDYKEITDEGRLVLMCHYPMPFHKAAYKPWCWMLYGHVHVTRENDMMIRLRKEVKDAHGDFNNGNWINVGCMMPWMNYTPRTLDELIAGDELFRQKKNATV